MSIFDADPESLRLVKPGDDDFLVSNLEDLVELQFEVMNEHFIDCITEGRNPTAPEEVEKYRELLKNTNWHELLIERRNNAQGSEAGTERGQARGVHGGGAPAGSASPEGRSGASSAAAGEAGREDDQDGPCRDRERRQLEADQAE